MGVLGVGVCAGVVCVPCVSLVVVSSLLLLSGIDSSGFSRFSVEGALLLLESGVGTEAGRGEALGRLFSGDTSPFCWLLPRGVHAFAFPS